MEGGKVTKWGEDFFFLLLLLLFFFVVVVVCFVVFIFCFYFFFFGFWFFFSFSLFKTTEMCFGSTKMEVFSWEKKQKNISRREKNLEKWLCTLRKIFLFFPWPKWYCSYMGLIWRADFQNLLHPLLHVTHLQLGSLQKKNHFQHKIYYKWKMLMLIEI